MKPTLNTPAGQYAVDIYLQDKKVNASGSAPAGARRSRFRASPAATS